MALPVVVTDQFTRELEELLTYLTEAWSNQVKVDFLVELADKIELIGRMPQVYPASLKQPSIRRCVVNRQTVLFYRVKPTRVEVLSIQSTRRDSNY